jgi:pimeloyl-ACP methyl ester carboxylesterase
MILRLAACLVLAVLAFIAVGGLLSAATASPPLRGQMVDIGDGRRLHIICEGPPAGTAGPTIVFEAGAFGFSADWGAVQQMATERGWRSCSYDRAGAGLSDPGPQPRDALKITDDLHALLNKAGEQGPFILVGHSMAGLYIPIYAKRWPDQVAGLVFVDATTPQATKERAMSGFATRFAQASKWAAIGASMGLFKPVTGKYGDRIGLPPAAKAEKKHAFASGAHNRNAYDEVKVWNLSGQQLIDAGPLNPELPVSVVTAGAARAPALQALRAAPAGESKHGYYRNVDGAEHRTLLGLEHGGEVIEGIARVRAAPAALPVAAAPSDRPKA